MGIKSNLREHAKLVELEGNLCTTSSPLREELHVAGTIPATASAASFKGIVGSNEQMRRLFRRIESIAATRSNVLIVGESGTGKELVAKAIHACASEEKPFVPFNCAAISRELIESELFGHRRGAFTGATTEHKGLLRAAEGGTAFLDEITEMSPEVQAKLLRAIQEHTVRPVGYVHEIPFEARIVASTNRDPLEAVRAGQLRADLYYRLEAHVLDIAPLRERRDDIVPLAYHFLALLNEQNQGRRSVRDIDRDALAALEAYSWPGNARELRNTMESALTFGTSPMITLDDLPVRVASGWRIASEESKFPSSLSSRMIEPSFRLEGRGIYAEFERESIARALHQSHGNKLRAAKILKISRKKLYDRISRYSLNDDACCRSCRRVKERQA